MCPDSGLPVALSFLGASLDADQTSRRRSEVLIPTSDGRGCPGRTACRI